MISSLEKAKFVAEHTPTPPDTPTKPSPTEQQQQTATTDTAQLQQDQQLSQQEILQQIKFLTDVIGGLDVSVENGSEEFLKETMTVVNHADISHILSLQDNIFKRFQESNTTLTGFNEFSQSMYSALSVEYDKNIKMVKEMKKDLDSIFKRIRTLQAMLKQRFPESFNQPQ